MPYQATYEDQTGIVIIRVYGSVPHVEHEAARNDAVRLCNEHHCKRLLVDLRDLAANKDVSITSCFIFGAEYENIEMPPATRIAHVMPTDSIAFDNVDFATTVAVNRGGLLQNFKSIAEAEAWLLH